MSEKVYDDEIAPKLKEISELCQRHGMPFVALCEYEPDQLGRTEFMPPDAGAAMTIAAYAARCDANVDSLMIAIQRYSEKHGHSSMVLTMLGQHPSPNARTTTK